MTPDGTPGELSGAPTRIGRYEVLSHLATGGMAQILLARQSGLGSFERHVVLKTILAERASDHRFVTMFLDEAKLAATLNHHNIAQVYEVDQADGAYFMAMEYVHGENVRAILETTLRRGWTIPLELGVMIVSGAAAGLHHAHERRGKTGQPLNIVHRDVSPANIMVGFDGSVKVLDFGIAKAEERATKTVGGTIKGKYGYMSPEQCKGKSLDRRSDIFALGIVLYELTTLRRAFKGNDDFETMKRIVSGDVTLPSVAVPGYPRELEAIVLTAMANDPNARFQTAQELVEALDTFTVRAKLASSSTAMGRFMVQLFGAKREPWVEAPQSERTEISISYDNQVAAAETDNSGYSDNEKTTLVPPEDQLTDDHPTVQAPHSPPSANEHRRLGTEPLHGYASPPTVPPLPPAPLPFAPGLVPQSAPPPMGQTMNWLGAPPRGATPPQGYAMPPPSQPNLMPAPHEFAPGTHPGAQPLVSDPRLGWQTTVGAQPYGSEGGTRMQSEIANYQIRSNSRWIILAVVLVIVAAGIGAMIAVL